MKLIQSIILLVTSILTLSCWAKPPPSLSESFDLRNFTTITIQAGTWLENYNEVRTSQSDGRNSDLDLVPFIGLGIEYQIHETHHLNIETAYIIQRTKKAISKNHFIIRTDYTYFPINWLKLKAGTSLMIMSLSSNGGEETLGNGTSTGVYYIPEETRTAYNQTLDFGIEFIFKKMSLRLQNYIYAWSDSKQRMVSTSLSLNFFYHPKVRKK